MIKRAVYLLMLIPIACTPKQVAQTSAENDSPVEIIQIVIDKESAENIIYFKVLNLSDTSILIYNHNQLHIEKENNGVWEKLQILSFPCGAPGARPAEFIEVSKKNHLDLSWNKEESWCGERNETPIPETITTAATPGKYRIMILYSPLIKEQKIIYKEFNI